MATFTHHQPQQQAAPQMQSYRSPPYRSTPHHVTPPPASSASTSPSYRFPVPNYVYGLEHLKIRATAGCTCKKSRCLKLYCQCFSNSSTCGPNCKCGDCKNTPANGPDIDAARRSIIHRNPGAFDTRPRWPTAGRSETEEYRQPPPGAVAVEPSFCRGSPGVRQGYGEEQRRMPAPRAVVMLRGGVVARPAPQPRYAPHPSHPSEHYRRGPRLIVESRQPPPTPRVYSVRATPPPPPPHTVPPPPPPPPPPKATTLPPAPKPEPTKDNTENSPDRMAMMAAIAMTELGRKRPLETESTQEASPPRKLPKPAAISALPRALSFRKICSQCGRTRADHGDMGFGHRCRFTDCAKCGVQANQHIGPMGVTCPVVDTPQAKRYAQHLGDLAAAADLQRSLKQQRSTSV